MYHHQLNSGYGLEQSEYIPPVYQNPSQPIYATNPNTISNFHNLAQQGNKRVRVKRVYHVVKNQPIEVPSHHEFERKRHEHYGEYCPDCNILPTYVREPFKPVQHYTPPPAVQYSVPTFSVPPPPEAPLLPIYTPPQYTVPINRNEASFTPDSGSNRSHNDKFDVNFESYKKEILQILIIFFY